MVNCEFIESDGGRAEYLAATNLTLKDGDCVTRAISHVARLPYGTVRERLLRYACEEVSDGCPESAYRPVLRALGFHQAPRDAMMRLRDLCGSKGRRFGSVRAVAAHVPTAYVINQWSEAHARIHRGAEYANKHANQLGHSHATALVDGNLLDSWDTRGCQVQELWIRKEEIERLLALPYPGKVSFRRPSYFRNSGRCEFEVKVDGYSIGDILATEDNRFLYLRNSGIYGSPHNDLPNFPAAEKPFADLRTLKREVKRHYQTVAAGTVRTAQ